MKYPAILMASFLTLAACEQAASPDAIETTRVAEDSELALEDYPGVRDKYDIYKLPPTVAPISDAEENFGIDLTGFDDRDRNIVVSAWKDYQLIVQGKKPNCPPTFGLSDGGSVMYDCGSYEIMRVKGLSGSSGYDYGPSINFLNGRTLERLKYLTPEEMVQLESAP